MPEPKSRRIRSAKTIIDQAIRENQSATLLLYIFSILIFVVGVVTLGLGFKLGENLTKFLGVVATLMFYPPLRLVNAIRTQNVAIRVLEIPLSKAETSDDAANVLREFFESTFRPPSHKKVGPQ